MSLHLSDSIDIRFVQVEPDQLGDPWKLRYNENEQPIARRRSHVKSRHGCTACKKRKVKHDFLMQAILLTSATHLSYLDPSSQIYHRAYMLHLHQTLRLFRHALAQPTTVHNADALMATSALLVYYAWDKTDGLFTSSSSSSPLSSSSSSSSPQPFKTTSESTDELHLDLGSDPLFSLARGLRQVFTNAFNFLGTKNTIFTSAILDGHCAKAHHNVHDEQDVADHIDTEDTDCASIDFASSKDVPSRLALLHGILKQLPFQNCRPNSPNSSSASSEDTDNQLSGSDMVLSVFYFPTCTTDAFRSLVQQDDSSVLMVMYFYYRAVEFLLPVSLYWWTRKRAELLAPAIERYLLSKGDKDIEIALNEGKKILHYYVTGREDGVAGALRGEGESIIVDEKA
ncbi:hypothetical protein B7463_g1300, partial [Scytalidium lignicola]